MGFPGSPLPGSRASPLPLETQPHEGHSWSSVPCTVSLSAARFGGILEDLGFHLLKQAFFNSAKVGNVVCAFPPGSWKYQPFTQLWTVSGLQGVGGWSEEQQVVPHPIWSSLGEALVWAWVSCWSSEPPAGQLPTLLCWLQGPGRLVR